MNTYSVYVNNVCYASCLTYEEALSFCESLSFSDYEICEDNGVVND